MCLHCLFILVFNVVCIETCMLCEFYNETETETKRNFPQKDIYVIESDGKQRKPILIIIFRNRTSARLRPLIEEMIEIECKRFFILCKVASILFFVIE